MITREVRYVRGGRQRVDLSLVLHECVASVSIVELEPARWLWSWSAATIRGHATGTGSARDETGARVAAIESTRDAMR